MLFDASLIVKREGWEGCLIFEVEVMSVFGEGSCLGKQSMGGKSLLDLPPGSTKFESLKWSGMKKLLLRRNNPWEEYPCRMKNLQVQLSCC